MLKSRLSGRGLALAAVLATALAAGACAQRTAQEEGAGGAGSDATPGSAQDFSVNVGDRVHFETDSTTLTSRARETLNRQAQWLRLYPDYQVVIEGHADERGTRQYNLGLGARRANVVRDYIMSHDIDGSRLSTNSYGRERPVATCNDESCWSQNRRAVTALEGAPTS